MRQVLIVAALILIVGLVAGCEDAKPTIVQHEIGPAAAQIEREKLAAIERMQSRVFDAIGGMQQKVIESVQKQQADRRRLCWQEGGRNCSGLR